MNKSDARILKRGLRRVTTALLTALVFTMVIVCFITTAMLNGYWAVLVFTAGLLWLGIAFILLYAQGVNRTTLKESKGERK